MRRIHGSMVPEAARVYALASVATQDTGEREQFARKAVVLLGRALQSPAYREPARRKALLEDAELASLRERADFKALPGK